MSNPDVCIIVSTPMFYIEDDPQKQWPLFGLLLLNSIKRYMTGSYKVVVVETEEEESILDLKEYCNKLGPNFQYERVKHPYPDYPICAKIEGMKKAIKAEKAVVLIDSDAGWFGHMDASWFDLGTDYDIGSFAGLNVSRTFPFTGKDWDYLRSAIDNKGHGAPKNPRPLGNCGTHITILNPRFINIQSFVDRWLTNSIKMFKSYKDRCVDNAAFTLLAENRRIKWVERDMHNCTFDYVNMDILLVRFPKLVALAQELYQTDKVFHDAIDKSPHRGTKVKKLLEIAVGKPIPPPNHNTIALQKSRPYLFNKTIPNMMKKYFYFTDPFSRSIQQIRPYNKKSVFNTRINNIQIDNNQNKFYPKNNNNTNTTTVETQTLYKNKIQVNQRIHGLYEKLRQNNQKKLMVINSNRSSTKFYNYNRKNYGRLY